MNPISQKIVERTWDAFMQTSSEDIGDVIKEISREDPTVLDYLLTSGKDIYNKDEQSLLFYVGTAVWYMMRMGDRPLKIVSDSALVKARQANLAVIADRKCRENWNGEDEVIDHIYQYNQYEMLRYIMNTLDEAIEVSDTIREENLGFLFLHLKSLLDCLDKH